MVSNVPEALIACVTVSLALTAKRMAKKNCLVKHLEAVEALGSVGIICSDKTGTLTMNRMTVSHMWLGGKFVQINPEGENVSHKYFSAEFENDSKQTERELIPFEFNKSKDWEKLIRCMMLCSRAEFKEGDEVEAWRRLCVGDASETAILQYSEAVYKKVLKFREKNPKLCEIAFNSTNKFQVSIHRNPKKKRSSLLVMKGAPEKIVERCDKIFFDGETLDLNESCKLELKKAYELLSGMGERVLGFCDLRLDLNNFPLDFKFDTETPNFPTDNLRFLGFLSLIDPPKPGVTEAISKCRKAGIQVFMVTGDHPITAKAIAKSVGIITEETRDEIAKRLNVPVDNINPLDSKVGLVTGSDLTKMKDADLDKIVRNYKEIVFARTSPQQKLIIVEACQRTKVLVGVTGMVKFIKLELFSF